jgi:hypothetical protein
LSAKNWLILTPPHLHYLLTTLCIFVPESYIIHIPPHSQNMQATASNQDDLLVSAT